MTAFPIPREELPYGILDHNGVTASEYPDSRFNLVPFPASKGIPFNADNLATVNNHSFLDWPKFKAAKRAAEGRWVDGHRDISWRLHVFLWAVESAVVRAPEKNLVELGTGRGFMAAAACLGLSSSTSFRGKFWLFDTFTRDNDSLWYYAEGIDEVSTYFSAFDFVEIVEGHLPGTLNPKLIGEISFLHIDLNSAEFEAACLDKLRDQVSNDTIFLFDDAGNPGCQSQLEVALNFAESLNRPILQLPTGQALVV